MGFKLYKIYDNFKNVECLYWFIGFKRRKQKVKFFNFGELERNYYFIN